MGEQPLASNKNVKYDNKALMNLIKCLKDDVTLRVGILGTKAHTQHDKDSSLTNADIGTIHEFGGGSMPRRSFLEDSIIHELKFDEEQMREMKKTLWQQWFVKNKPEQFMTDLGAECLRAIEDGFDTNGYGEWQPWSSSYEEYRKSKIKTKKGREDFWFNHNILTDTGKLRRSITFKVLKNGKDFFSGT